MIQSIANTWVWIGFTIFVIFALSLDTFFLNKNHLRPHQSMSAALRWTCIWIASAFIFNILLWIYLYEGHGADFANTKGLEFLAGYLIEKSLSVDNLFAFYMVFKQFRIPVAYQQRVFSYGIWSAIIMRLGLIMIGTWLIIKFHWIIYLMGAFLLLTGIKMCFAHEKEKDLADTLVIKIIGKCIRLTSEIHGNHFFIIKNGLRYATPIFIALIFIEISDLIFAFDSIPAIFAITTDPFIVWSSNIFAILGLRALYFLLAGLIERFQLLKYGIALILVFVGSKMLVEPWIHITVSFSLSVVISILLLFTLLSMRQIQRQGR